jgi:hypothetical protein
MQLVAAHPEAPSLRLELGEALLRLGQLHNAQGELALAQADPACAARALYGLGCVRMALGEPLTALAALRAAQAGLDPERRDDALRRIAGLRRCREVPAPSPRLSACLEEALRLARDEAARMNHPAIQVEHLLLGLGREREGAGGNALRSAGLRLCRLRLRLRDRLPRARDEGLAPRPDGRARLALKAARVHATGVGANHVQSEHLLSALLFADAFPEASRELGAAGVRWSELCDRVEALEANPALPLTDRAETALQRGLKEAARMGCRWTATPHVLLGLTRDPRVGEVLVDAGLTAHDLRAELAELLALRGRPDVEGPPERSLCLKGALRSAAREAMRSGATAVAPRHLLIGMLAMPRSGAQELLQRLGVDLELLEGALEVCADPHPAHLPPANAPLRALPVSGPASAPAAPSPAPAPPRPMRALPVPALAALPVTRGVLPKTPAPLPGARLRRLLVGLLLADAALAGVLVWALLRYAELAPA